MSAPAAPAAPRDAATVILLRDGRRGLQTWLLTRRTTLAFAAGMSVYPGGRVDPDDATVPLARPDRAAEVAAAYGIAVTGTMAITSVLFHGVARRWGWSPLAAGALVFVTSAAVLVLEILAARLLAPYVGVTLETYTGIIGTILAAIALGTWVGGRWADRRDPRTLLGPILIVGGVLSLCIVPIVRLVGALPLGVGPAAVVLLALAAFFAPAGAWYTAMPSGAEWAWIRVSGVLTLPFRSGRMPLRRGSSWSPR